MHFFLGHSEQGPWHGHVHWHWPVQVGGKQTHKKIKTTPGPPTPFPKTPFCAAGRLRGYRVVGGGVRGVENPSLQCGCEAQARFDKMVRCVLVRAGTKGPSGTRKAGALSRSPILKGESLPPPPPLMTSAAPRQSRKRTLRTSTICRSGAGSSGNFEPLWLRGGSERAGSSGHFERRTCASCASSFGKTGFE